MPGLRLIPQRIQLAILGFALLILLAHFPLVWPVGAAMLVPEIWHGLRAFRESDRRDVEAGPHAASRRLTG